MNVTEAIALPRPTAPLGDKLRVMRAAVGGMMRALVRRAFGRSLNPKWPMALELVIAATRGSWSVMSSIGMVRWRNVGEAMSPLRTDGLPPRFVNVAPPAAAPLYGAWLEPPEAEQRVLLYFHGGGFVFGSLRTHGELIGALARAARARTLALFYRLAPEHPAPAAVEDAVSAYRHLLAQGIEPGRIALAGDSAGGTLTLLALLALKEQGLPLPGAAVAISPWVDLGCSGASFDSNSAYDYVTRELCLMAAGHLLGTGSASSPAVSPAFAGLDRLPPLLVQAGALETLVDQIRALVGRATGDGIDVTYVEYPEMVHVWHLLRQMTPEGGRALQEAGAFIREHTARAPAHEVATRRSDAGSGGAGVDL